MLQENPITIILTHGNGKKQLNGKFMSAHKKLIFSFLNFITDRGVQVNLAIGALSFAHVSELIKLTAVVIGATYTAFKFYKEFIRDSYLWKNFKLWCSTIFNNDQKDL